MIIMHEITAIISRLMMLIWVVSLSCTTSRDIYRNPYQSAKVPVREAVYPASSALEASTQQRPEWIYAVSRDFIVGYGQGSDVMEARKAALNDIKAFIIKSMGETGKILEVNFVQNSVSGRNTSRSQEDYLLRYYFENSYKPVINISVDRFDDYYYEQSGRLARYFIKYDINQAELQRVKNEFQKSLQKEKALAIRTRRSVDSLTSLQGLLSVESLIQRYDAIIDFIYLNKLTKPDSLVLMRGLRNIRGFLDAVEVRVLDHEQGERLRFGLFSGQSQVHTKVLPVIRSYAIMNEELDAMDGIWDLRYRVDPELSEPDQIEILYELPYKQVIEAVAIEPVKSVPAFQIAGPVILSGLIVNRWSGKLERMNVRIQFQSDIPVSAWLISLELVLHMHEGIDPMIRMDQLNHGIHPGLNTIAREVDCDLPSRLFLRSEISCDVRFLLERDVGAEIFELHSLSVHINR